MRSHLLALVLSLAAGSASAQPADLILINGRVFTVEAGRPWAEAVAVTGERIAAVGTTAEIRKLAGPRTRVIDLKGAFVSPGFNDAHVHVDSTGALLVGANLLDVHTEPALVERIRRARPAAGTASALASAHQQDDPHRGRQGQDAVDCVEQMGRDRSPGGDVSGQPHRRPGRPCQVERGQRRGSAQRARLPSSPARARTTSAPIQPASVPSRLTARPPCPAAPGAGW
jgi:hypothetical protein